MDETSRDYEADGAAVVRGVVPHDVLANVGRAIERALDRPRATAVDYGRADQPGRFFNDSFLSRQDPAFVELASCPALLGLAAELLGARRVGMFFDQLLVKEPMTSQNMPWHQDLPYWPVDRPALVTVWVPLDPVMRSSGAVLYARGSQRWSQHSRRWRLPRPDGTAPATVEETAVMVEPSFIHFDVEPGDVVVHHPLAVHGSPGNRTRDTRRRAIAIRYFSDACRYLHRPDHILENPRVRALLPPLQFVDGDPLEGEAFPILWEREGPP